MTVLLSGTVAIALAGGKGTRMWPFTKYMAKPALPFGSKWRIIDLVLWSLYQSGIHRIIIPVQYHQSSIRDHIKRGWPLTPTGDSYVDVVAPEGRFGTYEYHGTADAVYQEKHRTVGYDNILIVGGDHVFLMNAAQVYESHQDNQADVTIMANEVSVEEAREFGVLEVDETGRVIRFQEKPEQPAEIPGKPGRVYASMGIYDFSKKALDAYVGNEKFRADCMENDPKGEFDFGKHVLPQMVTDGRRVFAYPFSENEVPDQKAPYWRDVGTLSSYYEANMDLTRPNPDLNLYTLQWPIPTRPDNTPPYKTGGKSKIEWTLAAGGLIASNSELSDCVLSRNIRIEDSRLKGVIAWQGVNIGVGCNLKKCIIDNGVNIPAGTQIGHDHEADARRFHVDKSGIVCVSRDVDFDHL